MEPPFFRSYYRTPPQPSHGRAPAYSRKYPTQTAPSPPRRVFIPVHFVDSVNKRSNSALKIQKTFRGFRVRKSVKKILELKREVDGVEKKLRQRVTMEVVKKDEKERLKINESLMALLFKLDSVRGFNEEIRDSRKRVIKKAILLQELVDSVVVDDVTEEKDDDSRKVNVRENSGVFEDDFSKMQVDDSEKTAEKSESAVSLSEIGDETLGETEHVFGEGIEGGDDAMLVKDSVKIDEKSETAVNSREIGAETLERTEDVVSEGVEGDYNAMQVEDSVKIAEESETTEKNSKENGNEGVEGGGESWECVEGETEEPKSECVDESDPESQSKAARSNSVKESSNDDWCVVRGGGEVKERKERLLEKMAEDNQRLMAMVADLCQKNVTQTKLICSLSQRVEQLEKAMNERLRKKKKCNVLHN